MKLNKKGRDELRTLVEKDLKNVPNGEKIQLDNSLLDTLLFETIIYKRNPKRIVKLPVWSGDFLQKLDLSQVSFKDVSWSLLSTGKDSDLGKKFFDEGCWNSFLSSYGDNQNNRVNYSNTNIKVNFNLSWEMLAAKEAKVEAGVEIFGCDFSYVDFSTTDASNFRVVRTSNFSNTHLAIPKSLLKSEAPIFFYTDLSGLDLSKYIIKLLDIITIGGPLIGVGCNLSDTRISIALDSKSLCDKTAQQNFRTVLMSGDLNGCFLNGKRIISSEERKKKAAQKLAEYEQYKQEKFNAVSVSIQKQIGSILK